MLMTIQQIKKIFEDMGIGTEDERRYFTVFAITQAPEPRLDDFDFIRLDDVSTSETKWVCCPFCGAEAVCCPFCGAEADRIFIYQQRIGSYV